MGIRKSAYIAWLLSLLDWTGEAASVPTANRAVHIDQMKQTICLMTFGFPGLRYVMGKTNVYTHMTIKHERSRQYFDNL